MAISIDTQLHDAIGRLNGKQKKALWGIVKVMSEEQNYSTSPLDDASFVAELDEEYSRYIDGKVEAIPFEKVLKDAREIVSDIKSKKTG